MAKRSIERRVAVEGMRAVKGLSIEERDHRTVMGRLADTIAEGRLGTVLRMQPARLHDIKAQDVRTLLRRLASARHRIAEETVKPSD